MAVRIKVILLLTAKKKQKLKVWGKTLKIQKYQNRSQQGSILSHRLWLDGFKTNGQKASVVILHSFTQHRTLQLLPRD